MEYAELLTKIDDLEHPRLPVPASFLRSNTVQKLCLSSTGI